MQKNYPVSPGCQLGIMRDDHTGDTPLTGSA
jgi:hypothetical protein